MADRRVLDRAALLRDEGQLAASAALLRQAAQRAPRDPEVLQELGLTLMNQHQYEPALRCFDKALKLAPAYGWAHFRRGIVLELLGRPGATAAYENAVAAGLEAAGVFSRLAACYEADGSRGSAVDLYRRAATLAPGTRFALEDAAQAALIEGDLAVAEQNLTALLRVAPSDGVARGKLAQIQAAHGDFAGATATLEQALRDAPGQVGLYYDLVQWRRVGADDEPLMERLRVALTVAAPPRARIRLLLAVAKANDDRGDYAAARAALIAADALRTRDTLFSKTFVSDLTSGAVSLFTPDFVRRMDHIGRDSELPVLVMGMPRSGTTLVERILAAHRQVAGAGEVHFWEGEGHDFLAAPGLDLRPVADRYLDRLRRTAPGADRVVDKMPFNFRWAALIHLALPRARLIHVRRNPADTCLSIIANDLLPSRSFSAARDELLFYYRDYLRAMAHMRAVLSPDCFMEVDYETLVHDPENTIRLMLAFCGLAWDPACLAPEATGGDVRTASVWQARQKMHAGSVGRWVRYADWLREFAELEARPGALPLHPTGA